MTTTRTARIDLAQQTVGEVMRRGVVGCAPEASLSEVARLMSEHRIHCVVVAGLGEDRRGARPTWGVVSDLDLARAATSDPSATAGRIAATEPLTAWPGDTLEDVARAMGEHDVAHILVLGETDAEPIGVVSTLDVARALAA